MFTYTVIPIQVAEIETIFRTGEGRDPEWFYNIFKFFKTQILFKLNEGILVLCVCVGGGGEGLALEIDFA